MKHMLIAPIHFLRVNQTLNKGLRLKGKMRLSNNAGFIEEKISKTDVADWAGLEGCRELLESPYIYMELDTDELIKTYGEQSLKGYCFTFLREVSSFLDYMWVVKDHNAYVRDGFIFNNKEIYKGSLSAVPSTSDGQYNLCLFSNQEIKLAGELFDVDETILTREEGKYPPLNPFNNELSRGERAKTFIIMARSTSILPLKIFNYCTALECLFTTDNTEVSHKISERVAMLLGKNNGQKQDYFQLIKKAYGIRSKLTHGQAINLSDSDLVEVSQSLDKIMRRILTEHKDFVGFSRKELEHYFMDLIFN